MRRAGFDRKADFLHNYGMKKKRSAERFEDFARVECRELCVVNGVLTDISKTGFKAEFNAPCEVDSEKEYVVLLRLSRVSAEPLELTVRPAWSEFSDGKTLIGFSILHSKDSARFESYVKHLKEEENSQSETSGISIDTDSLFI